jgi:hypothetical protein
MHIWTLKDLKIYMMYLLCHFKEAIQGSMHALTIHACLYQPFFLLTPLALHEAYTDMQNNILVFIYSKLTTYKIPSYCAF